MTKIRLTGIAFLFLGTGCFHPCPGQPSELVAGLQSQSSVASVRAALHDCDWTIVRRETLKVGDKRPRFEWLTVDATKCMSVPKASRVELAFFNDRLADVRLYGLNATYVDKLGREPGWRHGLDGSLLRAPATRVWTAVDYEDRPYVAWEDTCLDAERQAWIEAYA
jgi:hypothetical protein